MLEEKRGLYKKIVLFELLGAFLFLIFTICLSFAYKYPYEFLPIYGILVYIYTVINKKIGALKFRYKEFEKEVD